MICLLRSETPVRASVGDSLKSYLFSMARITPC